MTTATAPAKAFATVEEYLEANRDSIDPSTLFDTLLQQTRRIKAEADLAREEARANADVELDATGKFKPKNLAGVWRLGVMYSKSAMVPEHYRGRPDDCAIGVQMALRCKVDILTFLQSSYIVNGKPGIEAKLVIAMLNASGQIKGRVNFKLEGKDMSRQCTASVQTLDGEVISQTVTMGMAKAEGWIDKSGSKWKTIPDIMLQYRSAAFLARLHFPDVVMGMYTADELEDSGETNVATLVGRKTLDDLADQLAGTAPPPSEPSPPREKKTVKPTITANPESDPVAWADQMVALMDAQETVEQIDTLEGELLGLGLKESLAAEVGMAAGRNRERCNGRERTAI